MFKDHSIFFYFGSFDYLKENMLADIRESSEVYVLEYPFFSIDDSRELQKKVIEHTSGSKKTYVLHIEKIGSEAQHSLLKTCEEIHDYTLVFCFPEGVHIIPTLLSRGVVYTHTGKTLHFDKTFYDTFLNTTNRTEKLGLYEKYTKAQKTIDPRTLVKYIAEDLLVFESEKKNSDIHNKKILQNARELLHSIKTSPKQIYEYIVLMLKN